MGNSVVHEKVGESGKRLRPGVRHTRTASASTLRVFDTGTTPPNGTVGRSSSAVSKAGQECWWIQWSLRAQIYAMARFVDFRVVLCSNDDNLLSVLRV